MFRKKILWLGLLLMFLVPVVASAKLITITNKYVMLGVDDLSGRFFMSSLEGDPTIDSDNNQLLLDKSLPLSTVTILKIGEEFTTAYGSYDGNFSQRPVARANLIVSEWSVRGFDIIQVVQLVKGETTGIEDTVRLSYLVFNFSRRDEEVGVEIIFDTYLGERDGVPYTLPDGKAITKETVFGGKDLPVHWYAYDKIENPTLKIQGTIIHPLLTKPDKIIFGTWQKLFDEQWDFVASKTPFPNDPSFDTAVGIFYEPKNLENGESRVYSTMYGLYGASVGGNNDFAASASSPRIVRNIPFDVILDVENKSGETIKDLSVNMELPSGFSYTVKKGADGMSIGAGERIVLNYKIQSDRYFSVSTNFDIIFSIKGNKSTENTELISKRRVTIRPTGTKAVDSVGNMIAMMDKAKKDINKNTSIGSVKKNLDINRIVKKVKETEPEKELEEPEVKEEIKKFEEKKKAKEHSNIITNVIVVKETKAIIPGNISVAEKQMDYYYYQGMANFKLGYHQKALADFYRVVVVDKQYEDALFWRGLSFLKLGYIDLAIKDFTKTIEEQPIFPEAYNNLGNAYVKKKSYSKAINNYNNSIEINNENGIYYYNRGIAYCLLEDYDLALKDLNTAIELNPKFADAFRQRGIVFQKMEEEEKAKKDFDTWKVLIKGNF